MRKIERVQISGVPKIQGTILKNIKGAKIQLKEIRLCVTFACDATRIHSVMKEEIDYQFYKYLEQNDQVQPKQEIEKKLIRARNGER